MRRSRVKLRERTVTSFLVQKHLLETVTQRKSIAGMSSLFSASTAMPIRASKPRKRSLSVSAVTNRIPDLSEGEFFRVVNVLPLTCVDTYDPACAAFDSDSALLGSESELMPSVPRYNTRVANRTRHPGRDVGLGWQQDHGDGSTPSGRDMGKLDAKPHSACKVPKVRELDFSKAGDAARQKRSPTLYIELVPRTPLQQLSNPRNFAVSGHKHRSGNAPTSHKNRRASVITNSAVSQELHEFKDTIKQDAGLPFQAQREIESDSEARYVRWDDGLGNRAGQVVLPRLVLPPSAFQPLAEVSGFA